MEQIVCKRCGCTTNNMYMKEKGNNIGLYCTCSEDGTWVKWVSKEDASRLKRLGVKLDSSEHGKCTKCGSTRVVKREVGPHIGVFCAECDKWLRWEKRKSKR